MMIHPELLAAARPVRRSLLIAGALLFAVTLGHLARAVLLALALAAVARSDPAAAVAPLLWVPAVVLVQALLHHRQRVVAAAAGAEARVRLRDELLERLGRLGPAHLTGTRAGAVRATLVDGVEGCDVYLSRYLPQLVVTWITPPLVLLAVAVLVPAPFPALVLAAAVLLALLAPRAWDRLLARRGGEHWDGYERLNADYLEALQGMPALRAAGAVGRVRRRLEEGSERVHRATVAKLRVSLVDTGLTDLAVQGGTVVAVLLACWSAAGGNASATATYLVLMLTSEAFRPIRDLSREWHSGYLGVSAAGGIAALRSARPSVTDPADPADPAGAGKSGRAKPHGPTADPADPAGAGDRSPAPRPRTLPTGGRPGAPGITVRDIAFRHPGAARPALDGVHFSVDPGRVTALVGPSGAGKSTLLSLLARHHDPDRGEILLGDRRIDTLPLADLRRRIAVVSQRTHLFHAPVSENLRLARPDASATDLARAARAAGILDEILSLPRGWDTVLGERGETLSGGQRQRLALARALLSRAPVLLLDEATSAVDEHRESRITRDLLAAAGDRTCLVVAHRPAAVRDAHRIVVLDGGRVVEDGDHASLLAADGLYSSFVAAGGPVRPADPRDSHPPESSDPSEPTDPSGRRNPSGAPAAPVAGGAAL
ncbi:ABC transporter ATP-binding protein/permease [Streptomyces sp. ST2-7A]|uniref:ABC transporter ATP-binding protein/permease n=1 Tax=Streptomyces sp. ST2-7A TaxID=2907214 RepID=UPI001F15BCCD|nr:ABC transporter ATP-binding protein [Streptomyces sp. ST2-7A]MCE7083420.1 ABC transporter ATP-binding protein/permease [Streptomyces sp. ST2-7A]